jgi:hypothetical protein
MELRYFNKFPQGSDEPGVRHFRDSYEQSQPIASGWDITDVTYHIDSYGYRNKIKIGGDAAFGCSFTFGYGVNNPWPDQLGLYNAGQPSASNDKIARLIISYCEKYNPEQIFVMWTFASRREWVNDNNEIIPYKADVNSVEDPHFLLQNDNFDYYNFEKNKLLVHYFCKSKDIKLFECTVTTPFDHNKMMEFARDGKHPGQPWHDCIKQYFTSR